MNKRIIIKQSSIMQSPTIAPIKLVTKFESGPNAKFRKGILDNYGANLLRLAVEECDDKLTKLARHQHGPAVNALIDYINADRKSKFNGVLVNKYNDGFDYISPHSDKYGLDKEAGVVILSYGATRTMTFELRSNAPPNSQRLSGELFKNLPLEHNSISIMEGYMFHKTYTHELKKEKTCTEPSILFTIGVALPVLCQ